jgi:hypothetical protein
MNPVSATLRNACTVSVQYERMKDMRWYFCQSGKKAKNNKELSRTPKKSRARKDAGESQRTVVLCVPCHATP